MEIIKGMPEVEYRARPEVSQSDYKRFRLPTPAHAKWEEENPRESEAMEEGTCLHALILEGRRIFAVAPKADGRTKEGKEIKARFAAENEGKVVLSAEGGARVEGMAAGIQRNQAAVLLLESLTDRELSVFWDGQKARIDGVCPVGIVDLKTTRSAKPWDFSRAIEDYGYAIQAAHYLDAAAAAGLPCEDFYVIAAESFGSFECAVYRIGHESIEIGRRELNELRDRYRKCHESGLFPGYPGEPMEIGLPAWKLKEVIEGAI